MGLVQEGRELRQVCVLLDDGPEQHDAFRAGREDDVALGGAVEMRQRLAVLQEDDLERLAGDLAIVFDVEIVVAASKAETDQ